MCQHDGSSSATMYYTSILCHVPIGTFQLPWLHCGHALASYPCDVNILRHEDESSESMSVVHTLYSDLLYGPASL